MSLMGLEISKDVLLLAVTIDITWCGHGYYLQATQIWYHILKLVILQNFYEGKINNQRTVLYFLLQYKIDWSTLCTIYKDLFT